MLYSIEDIPKKTTKANELLKNWKVRIILYSNDIQFL